MAVAIACLVKTPGLSPIKTRLASEIGKEAAENLYRECLLIMLDAMEQVEEAADVKAYWAVAEPDAQRNRLWSDLPVVSQGPGDLGRKLKSVYENLARTHEGVILIGADCPLISPEILQAAAQKVKENKEHVIGLTDDGGYYLFGSRKEIDRPATMNAQSVWMNVPYSTPKAAAEFTRLVEAAVPNVPFHQLPQLFDIDTAADIVRLKKYLAENENEWTLHVREQLGTVLESVR